MLFDKFKAFPEAGFEADHVKLRRDAYVAFLDIRQLYEREIQAALDELARHAGTQEDARAMAQEDFERLVNQRVRELLESRPALPERRGSAGLE